MVAFINQSASTPESNQDSPERRQTNSGATSNPLAEGPLFFAIQAWLILCKRRVLLAGLWLASCAAIIWLLPQLPKRYTSIATVQLRKSLETVAAEDVGLKATEAAGQITEDYRDVQMGILTSEQLLRAAAAELVATEPVSSPSLRSQLRSLVLDVLSRGSQEAYVDEQVLQRKRIDDLAYSLQDNLRVFRGYKSPRVQLSFEHADAGRAQEVLQVLIDHYARQVGELYDMGPALARAEQLYSEARSEWELISRELQQYRAENDIVDLDRQTTATREDLQNAESTALELRVAAERAAARRASLISARQQIPASFPTAPSRVDNRAAWVIFDLLSAARGRLVESPFIEGSPEYLALKAPVDELEAELERQELFFTQENPDQPNASFFMLGTDLAAAEAEAKSSLEGARIWEARADSTRAELERLEACANEMGRLQRNFDEAELQRAAREEHVARLRGIDRMREADLLWSFKVIEPPTMPSGPSSMSRSVIGLALLAASTVLALMATLLIGSLDPSLRSPIELTRAFGVAPALCLPDLRSRVERRRILKRMGFGFLHRLRLPRATASGRSGLFHELGQAGVLLESRLGGLLGQVDLSPRSGRPRVIQVSGVHVDAGASTLALNVVRHMAKHRRGRVAMFICQIKEGSKRTAADLARAQATVADLPNVDIYAIDLRAETLEGQLAVLNSQDLVVMDLPPVLADSHVIDAARLADAQLLVARAHQSRRTAVRESVDALRSASQAPVGLVYNRHRECLPFGLESIAT